MIYVILTKANEEKGDGQMRISDLLKRDGITFSLEVFPPKTSEKYNETAVKAWEIARLHPDFMSVTYGAGGGTGEFTTGIAAGIQRETGVPALAHLTCVSSSREHVLKMLDLYREYGIENILALRGDVREDIPRKNDFSHASDMASYLREKYDFCILGACYPERHPESADMVSEIRHLKTKVCSGTEVLLSQLFFDNRLFYDFKEKCAIADISVPVIPGIMPVVKAAQIKRMIAMCNTSFPERFQRIVDLYADREDALFDAGMAYALSQIIDLLASGTDGIHLYTMNNPRIARRICEGIRNILP